MRYVAFDLDGVLLDSREIVCDAYKLAGIDAPRDVLSLEGEPWLEKLTDDVSGCHERKNEAYLNILRDTSQLPWLPPMQCAENLSLRSNTIATCLITGAPIGTIDVLRDRLRYGMWPFHYACDGMRTSEKMRWFRTLYADGNEGVYIDDQTHHIDLPPGWRFIHYTRQSWRELHTEVLR